jgi:hypothetical protein
MSKIIITILAFIVVVGSAVVWGFQKSGSRRDNRLFYVANKDGYYGLYERRGRSETTIFDSGDILQAYPNLARYHISYDVSRDARYTAYSAINVLGDADIFLYDSEDGTTRNLTSDTHTDTYPVFSRSGDLIAYLSHEKSGRRYDEIFLIRPDGSERQRLTNLFLRISSLSFSPDDRAILFAKHLGDRSSIALLDIETGEVTELTKPFCLNTSPSFNSSGDKIVFISDCHGSPDVWIMNRDGTGKKPLYKGSGEELDALFLKGDDTVAFISVSDEPENGISRVFSLLSVDVDGMGVQNLMPEKYRNRQLFMTHLQRLQSQNHVYFQARLLTDRPQPRYVVFILDPETHKARQVAIRGVDILDPVLR